MNIPEEVLNLNNDYNQKGTMPKNFVFDIWEMCRDFDKEKDILFCECMVNGDFTPFYEKYNLQKPKMLSVEELQKQVDEMQKIEIPKFETPQESDEWLKLNRGLVEEEQEEEKLETIEED